jgi:hypothetical protein
MEINIAKNNRDITIIGQINEPILENEIDYFAASPPDYRTTYTGSGLPFHSYDQAFDNTPNIGKVNVNNGKFKIELMFPNSYMVGLGSVTIPPTLYLRYKLLNGEVKKVSIKISEGIPYRMLTYPGSISGGSKSCARNSAMFYSNHHCLPVRTQEQVLRDSGFPGRDHLPENYWGLKPAL